MQAIKLLKTSLLRMLRPLIKVLIESGVSYQEFDELIRQTYVEVAKADFQLPNKKQSYSRIGLLTGIKRKEVQKILSQLENKEPGKFRQNAAISVVSGWCNDENYKNRHLALEGKKSFTELVKKYSGDIPVRAILDELVRVNVVEKDDNDNIHLIHNVYVPENSHTDKFEMIAESVRDLLSTGAFNLKHESPHDRLQLFVSYEGLTEAAVREFKKLSDKKSFALIKEYDAWLASQENIASSESGGNKDQETEQKYRVGVGIYYFEEEK